MNWNTTSVSDGKYTIKLEARDSAGNKCPNQSPVSNDPELFDDSVDWITVDVKNKYEAKAGDVVINEVMWMGSKGKPMDQWVELKNVSDKDMHIKDWYLTYKSNAGNELKLIEIKDNRILKKGEYLLLSYYTKGNSAINVQPDDDGMDDFGYQKFQIKLYTDSTRKNLIDVAGDGIQEPKEGDKANYYSMERNNIPGDGADYKNWHTCLDSSSTELYWDSNSKEQGTPGHENLSENDSSISNEETDNDKEDKNIIKEEVYYGEESKMIPNSEQLSVVEEEDNSSQNSFEDEGENKYEIGDLNFDDLKLDDSPREDGNELSSDSSLGDKSSEEEKNEISDFSEKEEPEVDPSKKESEEGFKDELKDKKKEEIKVEPSD
jgi:hypothetical protein